MDGRRFHWDIPHNKIYVYQPGKTVANLLKQYYSIYGEITTMRIFDDNLSKIGFGYAIINFNDGRLAEASIFNQSDGCKFRIFPNPPMTHKLVWNGLSPIDSVDFFQFKVNMNNDELNKPKMIQKENDDSMTTAVPNERSPSNILNALNDDCIQLIFEYLSVGDLCVVADTCKKFKKNATEIFLSSVAGSMLKANDLYIFECLLRNFGTKIRSLSIGGNETYWNENFRKNGALLILAKYCSSFKCQLRKLSIDNFNIQPIWYQVLRPVFNQLERLRLDALKVFYLPDICNELTELDLMNVKFDTTSDVLFNVFKKMNKLGIANIEDVNELLDQMYPNPAMKILKIHCRVIHNDTFDKICAKFPGLEQLEVQSETCNDEPIISAEDMIIRFAQMKNLNKLKISRQIFVLEYISNQLNRHEPRMNIFDILGEAGAHIEWLIIIDLWCVQTLKGIQKLKQLKRLELFCYENAKVNLHSAGHLTKLEELHAHFEGNGIIILKGITAFEKLEITNWGEAVYFECVEPKGLYETHHEIIKDYWIRDGEGSLGIRIHFNSLDSMKIVKRNLNGNPNLFEVLISKE